MQNKYIYGTLALALVALLAVGAVSAQFGNGFMNQDLTDEEKSAFEEQRQAIQNAVEDQDYATWEGLMQERLAKMEDEITPENFQKIIEKHSEMQEFKEAMQEAKDSGDYSKIQELKEEYGFEGKSNRMHPGMGEGKGMKQGKGMRPGSCPLVDSE